MVILTSSLLRGLYSTPPRPIMPTAASENRSTNSRLFASRAFRHNPLNALTCTCRMKCRVLKPDVCMSVLRKQKVMPVHLNFRTEYTADSPQIKRFLCGCYNLESLIVPVVQYGWLAFLCPHWLAKNLNDSMSPS